MKSGWIFYVFALSIVDSFKKIGKGPSNMKTASMLLKKCKDMAFFST